MANRIFINALQSSGKVSAMLSEENEHVIMVDPPNTDGSHSFGRYYVVFDPLDGSSNIDFGVTVGSIFGIYQRKTKSLSSQEDLLRPGRDMVAAGYAMYGSFTSLVLTTGSGVHGYTLDPSLGEFILTHPNMRIPKRGTVYSVNEGNSVYWDDACKAYFNSLKQPEGNKSPYSARYVGSMVADVHRTLLQGGIFAYPADKKSPSGKLRVLYECFPMAMILEQASGKASTGKSPLADIQPKGFHDRSPVFLGSPDDVNDLEAFYRKFP